MGYFYDDEDQLQIAHTSIGVEDGTWYNFAFSYMVCMQEMKLKDIDQNDQYNEDPYICEQWIMDPKCMSILFMIGACLALDITYQVRTATAIGRRISATISNLSFAHVFQFARFKRAFNIAQKCSRALQAMKQRNASQSHIASDLKGDEHNVESDVDKTDGKETDDLVSNNEDGIRVNTDKDKTKDIEVDSGMKIEEKKNTIDKGLGVEKTTKESGDDNKTTINIESKVWFPVKNTRYNNQQVSGNNFALTRSESNEICKFPMIDECGDHCQDWNTGVTSNGTDRNINHDHLLRMGKSSDEKYHRDAGEVRGLKRLRSIERVRGQQERNDENLNLKSRAYLHHKAGDRNYRLGSIARTRQVLYGWEVKPSRLEEAGKALFTSSLSHWDRRAKLPDIAVVRGNDRGRIKSKCWEATINRNAKLQRDRRPMLLDNSLPMHSLRKTYRDVNPNMSKSKHLTRSASRFDILTKSRDDGRSNYLDMHMNRCSGVDKSCFRNTKNDISMMVNAGIMNVDKAKFINMNTRKMRYLNTCTPEGKTRYNDLESTPDICMYREQVEKKKIPGHLNGSKNVETINSGMVLGMYKYVDGKDRQHNRADYRIHKPNYNDVLCDLYSDEEDFSNPLRVGDTSIQHISKKRNVLVGTKDSRNMRAMKRGRSTYLQKINSQLNKNTLKCNSKEDTPHFQLTNEKGNSPRKHNHLSLSLDSSTSLKASSESSVGSMRTMLQHNFNNITPSYKIDNYSRRHKLHEDKYGIQKDSKSRHMENEYAKKRISKSSNIQYKKVNKSILKPEDRLNNITKDLGIQATNNSGNQLLSHINDLSKSLQSLTKYANVNLNRASKQHQPNKQDDDIDNEYYKHAKKKLKRENIANPEKESNIVRENRRHNTRDNAFYTNTHASDVLTPWGGTRLSDRLQGGIHLTAVKESGTHPGNSGIGAAKIPDESRHRTTNESPHQNNYESPHQNNYESPHQNNESRLRNKNESRLRNKTETLHQNNYESRKRNKNELGHRNTNESRLLSKNESRPPVGPTKTKVKCTADASTGRVPTNSRLLTTLNKTMVKDNTRHPKISPSTENNGGLRHAHLNCPSVYVEVGVEMKGRVSSRDVTDNDAIPTKAHAHRETLETENQPIITTSRVATKPIKSILSKVTCSPHTNPPLPDLQPRKFTNTGNDKDNIVDTNPTVTMGTVIKAARSNDQTIANIPGTGEPNVKIKSDNRWTASLTSR